MQATMQTLSRPALGARPVATRAARSRSSVMVRASDKPMWYPGATPAPGLDASAPGYYGFDPLRLASGGSLNWFSAAETYNGRWAMMAVPGILFAEATGVAPKFWEVLNVSADEIPLGGFLPFHAIHLGAVGVFEIFRWNSWKKNGTMNGIAFLNPFDPMGMASPETQQKEIKNARLAMIAFLGFASQGAVRGMGPIECLKLHLEDPGHNNIFTSAVGPEATVGVIALAVAPFLLQARKVVGGGKEEEFRPIPFV